ncbi:MAG: PHP domain-containing protein [Lachnospiraceae bacterium]|nr:PHP domain-containing protein [Lachnospiraceae bacterium]MBP5222272.1 PHP domain-containing protein [Lachnospiraceae bacterium]
MSVLKLTKEYPFAYETHLHTSEGSACGRSTGAEMARACKAAGYTGIFVTEHFFYGNTAIDRSLPWTDWVEGYCKGYEHAKEEGDRIGLQVFFGWESTYDGTDFLIYGLDKAWLLAHPQIRDCSIEEQYRLVKADGGIVIHAHPFRERDYIKEVRLFPEWVDGVEVVNAAHVKNNPNDPHPEFDDRALEYALKYDFPQTGGSDAHSVRLMGGGMVFPKRLESMQDFMDAVMGRTGKVLQADPDF